MAAVSRPPRILPGDCLLYTPTSAFGWAIAVKTWHWISHIEIALGPDHSVASRDGIGVGQYPHRADHLTMVLRPTGPLDLGAAAAWFTGVNGQGYDYLGLLRFTWRAAYVPGSVHRNRMFCSEFATRWYRAAGLDPFPREDADAIVPSQFASNPLFTLAWSLVS